MKKYLFKCKALDLDPNNKWDKGKNGEYCFQEYFKEEYPGRDLRKTDKEEDYSGVDFYYGYTKFDVKCTTERTYTFHKLVADFYPLVHWEGDFLYLEGVLRLDQLILHDSYTDDSMFMWRSRVTA